MKRIAAHAITFEGKTYPMSVFELTNNAEVNIYPLTREIHSTRFITGHISVSISSDGSLRINRLTNQ